MPYTESWIVGMTNPLPAVASRNSSPMPEKSRPLRILVVDDEPLIRWSLAETLSEPGYHVAEAADAEHAVQAVTAAPLPFDVILLDFRLPDSNDLTLLSRLRRLAPATQIILMTAYGTSDILQGALDLGAYRVIGKPFEMNEVASLVSQASASRP
jgi:DNA-binding NtrC family response regulator